MCARVCGVLCECARVRARVRAWSRHHHWQPPPTLSAPSLVGWFVPSFVGSLIVVVVVVVVCSLIVFRFFLCWLVDVPPDFHHLQALGAPRAWVEDMPFCMHCEQKFSIARRRHHCRMCVASLAVSVSTRLSVVVRAGSSRSRHMGSVNQPIISQPRNQPRNQPTNRPTDHEQI